MKKKIFIPFLLLGCCLTACGGDEEDNSEFMTKGKPFKEEYVAVKDSVKNKFKDSFKSVTVNIESEVKYAVKYGTEWSESKSKSLETVDINMDTSKVKVTLKSINCLEDREEVVSDISSEVEKVDGNIEIIHAEGSLLDVDYETFYTMAENDVYSWNFKISTDVISAFDSSSIEEYITTIKNNIIINGRSGTFNVGLAKELPVTINNQAYEVTKFKDSYKDYLLQSILFGLSTKADSYSIEILTKQTYSYVMR